MWWGKVNQHNENGAWKTDPDGVSGANLDKLEYCRKFWPDTTKIQTSAPERILFHDRGNINAYWSTKPVWLCLQENIGKVIHGLLVEIFIVNSFYICILNIMNTADQRPRISMWWGKVNQHNENGAWKTDPDSVSGANLDKLEYCKKFWPDTTKIQTSASERILFHDRGNINAYWSTKPVWLCVQENIGKFRHSDIQT